jgi:Calcineurin-like phosphoesterase
MAEALPIEDGSWTLVLLPDTQYYAESYPQHFDSQTRWIVDHAQSHNIKCVLHEGDITNDNSTRQWNNALRSMRLLDGIVPYAMAVGNHDYGPGGNATDRVSKFNESRFFGPHSPYAQQQSVGGFYEPQRTDNSYHTFEAGGQKWLVLALEWAPRDEVVAWANRVVEDHPDHLTMLVTHAYMYYDDTRYDWAAKGDSQQWNPHSYGVAQLPGETVNDGQQLWDKLVSRHKNFRFAFNGHVLEDGTGKLASAAEHGNKVHQILANYQFNPEGGQGDMRLLEFKQDGKTVVVRTYSPVLDRYDTADDQQFTLEC